MILEWYCRKYAATLILYLKEHLKVLLPGSPSHVHVRNIKGTFQERMYILSARIIACMYEFVKYTIIEYEYYLFHNKKPIYKMGILLFFRTCRGFIRFTTQY
jgi:hypothetical protein